MAKDIGPRTKLLVGGFSWTRVGAVRSWQGAGSKLADNERARRSAGAAAVALRH